MASPPSSSPSPTSSPITPSVSSSNVVEWSSHIFCTYAICRATLPAREGLHDIGTHFTHLPLEPLPDSLKRKRKGSAKEPERKSSAVVFTGREEWMDGYVDEDGDEGTEADNELMGMQRLTPILSEES
jgi:hypothetical protein